MSFGKLAIVPAGLLDKIKRVFGCSVRGSLFLTQYLTPVFDVFPLVAEFVSFQGLYTDVVADTWYAFGAPASVWSGRIS